MMNLKWATDKKEAFKTAMMTGLLGDLVKFNGGTGELRRELTQKEYNKRKKRNKIAKASRQFNRKRGN